MLTLDDIQSVLTVALIVVAITVVLLFLWRFTYGTRFHRWVCRSRLYRWLNDPIEGPPS